MKIALISTNDRFVEHGLRSISAYLKENGFETIMIFMPLFDVYESRTYSEKNLNDLLDIIKDCQVIGFTCMSRCYERTVQLINFLRPKTKSFFVWGGIHATLFPENCIYEVNAVCIGEGEEALFELVTKIKNNENYYKIENFWFNCAGNIIKNPIRKLIENLDILPYPDYCLETQYILHNDNFIKADIFFNKDNNFWLFSKNSVLIHSTRGCLYNCTYCANNALNKIYKGKGHIIRSRSVDKIIGEIKYLLARFPDAEDVIIDDDIFPVRPIEEIKEFCKKYKKEINLPFECNFTPHFIDEDKFKLLIDAGLTRVLIGVQTGSERINKDIYKRHFTNKMIFDSSKLIAKYKNKLRPTTYQFIISNPYEKEEDLISTINLIQNISPPFNIAIFNLVFFPGTEMRKMVEKDKIYTSLEMKSYINFADDLGHMKYEKENLYLNSILRCLEGKVNNIMVGLIPRFLIYPLLVLNKSKLKQFGLVFILSIVYLKAFRNIAYFKLMPLFPKSLQNITINVIKKVKG